MKNATQVAAALAVVMAALHSRVQSEPLRFGGPTMGTTYHVRLAAVPPTNNVHELKAQVEALLADVDRQMSTYRPDSELSRFNRGPEGKWIPVSKPIVEIIATAREISEKTGGALDVTVGPLVRLWRFGPQPAASDGAKLPFAPPTDERLNAARNHVGYQKLDVRMEPPALRKQTEALEVDLSSIAPGYAVDRMAALLMEHEISDFMVEIGGEVRAAGRRGDGQPWRVAIERPLVDRREMQLALPLVDAAISTAGDYRKYFEHGGRRYSHIIDPATGRPVDHTLASVTVVANTCLAADGWDTPLLVLGPERGFQCAEKHGIAALFVSRGSDEGVVRTTRAWRATFDK
jgi:thiamine biosynthesis lipoprotein